MIDLLFFLVGWSIDHSTGGGLQVISFEPPALFYADLLNRMITAAQEALRIAPTLLTPENEKYAMRGWLLRLGYGGSDLKARRRILLENLKGYAAFRDDSGMERHKAKYAELRRQEREMRSAQPADFEAPGTEETT